MGSTEIGPYGKMLYIVEADDKTTLSSDAKCMWICPTNNGAKKLADRLRCNPDYTNVRRSGEKFVRYVDYN